MSEASQESANNEAVSHLLFRPMDAFQSIPPAYRWEFTRRHPYYLLCWELARVFRERPSSDERERLCQHTASLLLNAVNVAPDVLPPDPREENSDLGFGSIAGGWESGAVAPAIFRTLAHTLLNALPKAQRSQFGRLLNESAEFESTDSDRMREFHVRLGNLPGEIWNSFPDAPVVGINLQSPQRAITEAVEILVRRWKADRGITESRRRDEKLAEYLQVWDLREGWCDGAYDGSREKKLCEVANQLQLSLTTVANRYRAAFLNLTGHDYRPELYLRLFGVLKFSNARLTSQIALHRPWRSRTLRPVSEVDLLPGRREPDRREFLACAGITASDLNLIDLQLDISSLIERGLSDTQIRDEYFPERSVGDHAILELIAAIRTRHDDAL